MRPTGHGSSGGDPRRRARGDAVAPQDPRAHPASRAWARLRPGAAPTAVRTLQEKAKGAVYRLEGAGPDGAAIVAKRCSLPRIRRERVLYESVMPALPRCTVRYHGAAEDVERGAGWLFLDDAGGGAYSAASPEHRALAGEWLARLHLAAAERAPSALLPVLDAGFYLDRLREACVTIARWQANPALGGEDVAVLWAILAECRVATTHWPEVEHTCAGLPRTLAHGDFAPKNMRVGDDAGRLELVPFDWGSAGWGTAAADLVQWSGGAAERWDYWASPDLDAYRAAVRMRWPTLDAARLGRAATIGKLFRCLVCIALSAQSLATPWVERAMRNMRIYEAEVADALRSAGWLAGAEEVP